jgi:hypothetical protein
VDKKAVLREYKLSHRPMGVFQIVNKQNGKVFVDSSNNVPGKINRHKFALNHGSHASKSLQADWNELGQDAFEFETIEPVEPRDDPNYNYKSDLEFLEDLWLEKLKPYDENGYNIRKKTRDERLRMISQKQTPI